MRDQDIALFFNVGLVICIIMAVVNLFRYRSRGASAYYLSAAFAALGFLFLSLIRKWPDFVTAVLAVIIAACLIGDFVYRSTHRKDLP